MSKKRKNRLLSKAIRIASEAHEEMLDKGNNPYILHPLRIMFGLGTEDEELCMIALLHDVVEDSNWTFEDLYLECFPERVINALKVLTHDKSNLSYMEYIEKICENEDAVRVKKEDLRDNSDITRLKGVTQKDLNRMEKYHKAYLRLCEASNTGESND